MATKPAPSLALAITPGVARRMRWPMRPTLTGQLAITPAPGRLVVIGADRGVDEGDELPVLEIRTNHGARRTKRKGMLGPRRYQSDALVRRWLSDRCELGPTMRERSRELWVDFKAFALSRTDDALGLHSFGRQLLAIEGITRREMSGGRYFFGLRLRPDG